ncbi:MAG: tyrosine-type recombinase/integrase [Cellulomonas sp.]|nr:tyrosine-type recombinase/integrase [Cellulomonas sp.]
MSGELWPEAVDGWLATLRAAGRSPATVRARSDQLRSLAALHADRSPWELTTADLAEWLESGRWAPETKRVRRSAAVGFYDWGLDSGRVPGNPAARLARVPRPLPKPRLVRPADYAGALAAATASESLMLRLAAEVGLRRAEVASVHSADLVDGEDGAWLRIRGKGGRGRTVPLPRALAGALEGLPPGWAFPGNDGGHLSPRWVGKRVGRRLPPGVSMHALRHTFATRAYGVERDLFTVQELLGHAHPDMTRRYVTTSHDDMRSVVRALERNAR